MDMDQRTRLLGGRGGRVILLGDGTEIITGSGDDEDDVDMGEAEEVDDSDIEEQIKKGQAESSKTNGEDRVQREGTPGPKAEEPTKDSSSTATPEEPKIKAATDGPASQ
jgi:protein phosphatase 2C family protein 2/3